MKQAIPFIRQLQAHRQVNHSLVIALTVEAGQILIPNQLIQDGGINPKWEDKQVPGFGQGLDSKERFTVIFHLNK
jgi:hypothetical protein